MGGCAAFSSGSGSTSSQGCIHILQEREAEAAEPSTHNEAGCREGEGRQLQLMLWTLEQEWWEKGRDKRETGRDWEETQAHRLAVASVMEGRNEGIGEIENLDVAFCTVIMHQN